VTLTLGERIARIRKRLRKSQSEFADIIGSQQNSISRYETDRVVPGVDVLWRLHGLAEHDEKETFAAEIRLRIGTAILGQEATVEGSMEELRPILGSLITAEQLKGLNPTNRPDIQGLLAVLVDLLELDKPLDNSVLEILRLWQKYGPKRVHKFREAAAFLRGALGEAAPEDRPVPLLNKARAALKAAKDHRKKVRA